MVKSSGMEQQLRDMQDKILNKRFRTNHCDDIERLNRKHAEITNRKDSLLHHVDPAPWHAAVETEEAAMQKLRAELAVGSEELDEATNTQHASDVRARDEVVSAMNAESAEEQRVLDLREKVNSFHSQTQRAREGHQLAAKQTVEQEERARR